MPSADRVIAPAVSKVEIRGAHQEGRHSRTEGDGVLKSRRGFAGFSARAEEFGIAAPDQGIGGIGRNQYGKRGGKRCLAGPRVVDAGIDLIEAAAAVAAEVRAGGGRKQVETTSEKAAISNDATGRTARMI